MAHTHDRPSADPRLLVGLAKTVIEAALEAELAVHIDASKRDPARVHRGLNSRNGSRAKTVRTVVGPIRINVPRDRWGTFDPVTVGKWQREVVGVDRLVLPLAAKGAPIDEVVALLARVYPFHVPEATLARIASTVRTRVAGWHERRVEPHYPRLDVHLSALRTRHGAITGFPVASVIGVSDTGGDSPHRELLSVHAMTTTPGGEHWHPVLADLRRRGLSGVRSVVHDGSTRLRDAVARVWPAATPTVAHSSGPRQPRHG